MSWPSVSLVVLCAFQLSTSLDVLLLHTDCNHLNPPTTEESSSSTSSSPVSAVVELVNSQLARHGLKAVDVEVGCAIPFSTLLAFVSRLHKPLFAVITSSAPHTSSSLSAEGLSQIIGRREFSLLHVGITASTVPAYKTVYHFPFSYSMLGSPNTLLSAVLALIKRHSWKSVNVLYQPPLSINISRLVSSLDVLNVTHKVLELVQNANLSAIDADYQLQLAFVGDYLTIHSLLCQFFHSYLRFPTYQFVFVLYSLPADTSWHLSSAVTQGCTTQELLLAARGTLIFQYHFETSALKQEEILLRNLYASEAVQGDCFSILKASLLFDAMWSLSLALNSSVVREGSEFSLAGGSLNRDSNFTSLVSQELRKLDFSGLTGRIQFGNSSGNSIRNIAIYQFRTPTDSWNPNLVATFFSENSSLEIHSELETSSAHFTPTCTFKTVTAPRSISSIFFALSIITTLCLLANNISILCCQKKESVKASSFKLMQLIFLGCYFLMAASVANTCVDGFMDTIPPQVTCYLWHALNYFGMGGLTLMFGSLCLRTWRLYRIFVHFRKPGNYLSDRILLAGVLACFCLDTTVVVIWIAVDPFVPKCITLPGGRGLGLIRCTQNYFFTWYILLSFFNVLLMVMCIVLALLVNHGVRQSTSNSQFNTRNTLCSVFWTVGTMVVGLTIYTIILLDDNVTPASITSRMVILNVLFLTGVAIVSFLVTLPPLLSIIKCHRSMRTSTSTLCLQ